MNRQNIKPGEVPEVYAAAGRPTTVFDAPSGGPRTDPLRQVARNLLARAVEAKVTAWVDVHAHLGDERGHRQLARI